RSQESLAFRSWPQGGKGDLSRGQFVDRTGNKTRAATAYVILQRDYQTRPPIFRVSSTWRLLCGYCRESQGALSNAGSTVTQERAAVGASPRNRLLPRVPASSARATRHAAAGSERSRF